MKTVPAVSTYTVDFNEKAPRRATQAATGRVPRVVRMLALAHRVEGMIRAGELRDFADAARAIDVTRARMTQIMNLLLLAPETQEAILGLPPVTGGCDPVTERGLRPIVAEPNWEIQKRLETRTEVLNVTDRNRNTPSICRRSSPGR